MKSTTTTVRLPLEHTPVAVVVVSLRYCVVVSLQSPCSALHGATSPCLTLARGQREHITASSTAVGGRHLRRASPRPLPPLPPLPLLAPPPPPQPSALMQAAPPPPPPPLPPTAADGLCLRLYRLSPPPPLLPGPPPPLAANESRPRRGFIPTFRMTLQLFPRY